MNFILTRVRALIVHQLSHPCPVFQCPHSSASCPMLFLLIALPLSLADHLHIVKTSSYIAQYPVLRTAQSALHFTSLTDLFTKTPSRLLWEASSHMLQLMREGCSYTYPPLSIARYSFLFSWVNWSNVEWKNLPKVLTPQPGFEPGFS